MLLFASLGGVLPNYLHGQRAKVREREKEYGAVFQIPGTERGSGRAVGC